MKRNHIIFALCFLGLTAVVFITVFSNLFDRRASQVCLRCNVILISVDALGAKHLGLFDSSKKTSPLIDKFFGGHGLIFDRAYTQSPWTLPSHISMLTGRYAADFNVWLPTDKLPDSAVTIAEVMRGKRYETKAISYGFFVQPEWGLDQGFNDFSGAFMPKDGDDADELFKKADSWLKSRSAKKPFFLFLHSFHLNNPYTPSKRALEGVGADPKLPWVKKEDVLRINNRESEPSVEEKKWFEAAYEAEIREFDDAFGRFINELASTDLLSKTVIIFTADHGEEQGEHGIIGFHAQLFDETLHVPLFIVAPNLRHVRSDGVVEVRSIPATILSLVGLPAQNDFLGPSLQTTVDRQDKEDEESTALSSVSFTKRGIFQALAGVIKAAEGHENDPTFNPFPFQPKPRQEAFKEPYAASVRSYRWRLIKDHSSRFELFDTLADPNESKNLLPGWDTLASEDRRSALFVMKILGATFRVPCGIYCPPEGHVQ